MQRLLLAIILLEIPIQVDVYLFYQEADGVWLDEFNTDWITNKIIIGHLEQHKRVCVVSSELHGREYQKQWRQLRKIRPTGDFYLQLCTDHPVQAREFFGD